ncbi:hypothetical protein B0H13DRAFT_1917546 [Mycena leptocephala]|nr:hypothetical protein B0H13DRAFT_1917546 [Mycena leptocephala]
MDGAHPPMKCDLKKYFPNPPSELEIGAQRHVDQNEKARLRGQLPPLDTYTCPHIASTSAPSSRIVHLTSKPPMQRSRAYQATYGDRLASELCTRIFWLTLPTNPRNRIELETLLEEQADTSRHQTPAYGEGCPAEPNKPQTKYLLFCPRIFRASCIFSARMQLSYILCPGTHPHAKRQETAHRRMEKMSAEPKILPLEPVQKTAAGGSGTYHDPAYCGKVSFEPTQLEIEGQRHVKLERREKSRLRMAQ